MQNMQSQPSKFVLDVFFLALLIKQLLKYSFSLIATKDIFFISIYKISPFSPRTGVNIVLDIISNVPTRREDRGLRDLGHKETV